MKRIKFDGKSDPVFEAKIRQYHEEFLKLIESWIVKPQTRRTIKVELCDRFKSYGGYAYYGEMRIKLNYWMLYKSDEDLHQTYGHELAHLIAYLLFGYRRHRWHQIRPHGREWQHVMKGLGLVPHRCHRFGYEERERMKKEYRKEKHGHKHKDQAQQENDVLPQTQPGGGEAVD